MKCWPAGQLVVCGLRVAAVFCSASQCKIVSLHFFFFFFSAQNLTAPLLLSENDKANSVEKMCRRFGKFFWEKKGGFSISQKTMKPVFGISGHLETGFAQMWMSFMKVG